MSTIDLVNDEALRLNTWLIKATANDERSITYFESILRNFHAEQLAEDPKRKTIISLGEAS